MLKVFIAVAGAVCLATTANAETLYLTCRIISEPKYTFSDIYAKPNGVNNERYIDDLWDSEVGFFTMPPAKTWVVDTDAGTVETSEGMQPFQITEFSASIIRATFSVSSNSFKSWSLNRINGELKFTAILDPERQKSWQSKHGKLYPSYWEWTEQCRASFSPKM